MRIVALYRVSTQKQSDEGTSLDAQRQIYHELAAQRGWTTVNEFRGCESATQANNERRVLQDALQCIRENQVDGLWVIEQSRLSRGDDLEVALLMREIKERRIKIIVRESVRDMASLDERFMLGIQSVVDRAEADRIKERFQRGKKMRATRGEKASGPAPFGYVNPGKGMAGRGKLQVLPAQAAVVRRVFEMALQGMGNGKIAAELNARGVPASRGGKWVKNAISRTLMNPAYVGTAASGVWVGSRKRGFRYDPTNARAILIPNAHPAIIDKATFDAVNGRARNPRTGMPRLLTNLLYVGGHKYGGDVSRGLSYYRGPRGLTGLPWLNADETEARIWDDFCKLATGAAFVEGLMEAARDDRQQSLIAGEIEHLEEQVARRERRLKHLTELRLEGDIDATEYRRRKDEEEQALAGVRDELARQHAKAASLDTKHAPRIAKAVQVLLAGKRALATSQRRQILCAIVRRIDAEVELASAPQRRAANGQVLGGRVREWKVKRVTFHLALPNATAGEYGPHAGSGAGTARGGAVDSTERRARQLDTTSSDCGPMSGTGDGCRAGQKDTTS